MATLLSIIIPVYNEERTALTVINRVLKANTGKIRKEIIVVNDGSHDSTPEKLRTLKDRNIRVVHLPINLGKGNAIQAGITQARGDILLVQDADLEYDPAEYGQLLDPITSGKADVVFGSRFVGHQAHRVHFFWHSVGNRALTLLSNMMTNLNLTDMETGYKVFTKDVARKLILF